MNNSMKKVLIFSVGMSVGFVCGAGFVAKKLIESETFRPAIVDALANKIKDKFTKENSKPTYYKKYYSEIPFEKPKDIFVFENRELAEKVLDCLEKIITEYGQASVADLKDLAGLNANYQDNKKIWTNLDKAEVLKIRDGYTIKLPSPITQI